MKKIYYYPKVDLKNSGSQNPYILDFEKALSKYHTISNKKINTIGVLDFFKYLFISDIYVFNWIEDISKYKYGKIQVVVFALFLCCTKLFRNKIIWVLHNKYSHFSVKNKWTDFMFKIMMKNSDLIITHSSSGKSFAKENYLKNVHKIKYAMHPVKEPLPLAEKKIKKYDFLLWGTIWPYKGIVQFLQYLKNSGKIDSFKILIVGKCPDKQYKKQLLSYVSDNIVFEEKFYDFNTISEFAAQSKFILFTHAENSVLSSGVLMDSLRMNTKIIGPDFGSFHDLGVDEFIRTYSLYEDIVRIYSEENYMYPKKTKELFNNNNWDQFSSKLDSYIKSLFK